MVRMRFLASARPLCQVEMAENNNSLRVYLYDGEALYPETQRKLERRLIRLATGELIFGIMAMDQHKFSIYRIAIC